MSYRSTKWGLVSFTVTEEVVKLSHAVLQKHSHLNVSQVEWSFSDSLEHKNSRILNGDVHVTLLSKSHSNMTGAQNEHLSFFNLTLKNVKLNHAVLQKKSHLNVTPVEWSFSNSLIHENGWILNSDIHLILLSKSQYLSGRSTKWTLVFFTVTEDEVKLNHAVLRQPLTFQWF